jgi:hypothetical protein
VNEWREENRCSGFHIIIERSERTEMRREIEIVNELGLHARPAAEFVRCVNGFDCEVIIWKAQKPYDGGSILGVFDGKSGLRREGGIGRGGMRRGKGSQLA